MSGTVVWDYYKRKKKFKALLKNVLFELKQNQKRANETMQNLPAKMNNIKP